MCEVSSNDKDTVKCRVEVWDENTMRSNTLIGVAEVSIRPLFDHIGNSTEIRNNIFKKKKKKILKKIQMHITRDLILLFLLQVHG